MDESSINFAKGLIKNNVVILKYILDLKMYFKVTSNWRVLVSRQKLNNGKLLKFQKVIQMFIKVY